MPTDRITSALQCLTGEHISGNVHRLGAIGAQDVKYAIEALRAEQKERDTARSTLAQKVLERIEQATLHTYEPESKSAEVCRNIAHSLRELFQREGN